MKEHMIEGYSFMDAECNINDNVVVYKAIKLFNLWECHCTKNEPGDLIEIFRGTYQHWALYVGEGDIIHLCPPSESAGAGMYSLMSVLCDRAVVTREGLGQVVGRDRFHVNNLLDKKHQPRRVCAILRDASRLLGLEMPYCILRGNCEHFVTQLRYGKAESRQVHYIVGIGVGAVGVGMKALTTASSISCVNSKKSSQQEHHSQAAL